MLDNIEEAYLALHDASGIKPGDPVRILCKAKSHEMGWQDGWVNAMNATIGKVSVVTRDARRMGFALDIGYGYPFFCLEIINESSPESRAPDSGPLRELAALTTRKE